jgi:hypothetical protein
MFAIAAKLWLVIICKSHPCPLLLINLQSTNEALSRTSDQQSRENDALQTDLSEAEVRITDEQERQSILQKKFEELNHLYTHVRYVGGGESLANKAQI